MNYFRLLELPESFALDIGALEQGYFRLQRQWHPDRFVGKTAEMRREAIECSIAINDAYHTLKDPLSRAQYLLEGQGILVGGEKDTLKPPMELLMESMEAREALMEAQTREALIKMQTDTQADTVQCLDDLARYFTKGDYNSAAISTLRLAYLRKLQQEIALRMTII